MAVYTQVSDAALAAFLADYDIGEPRALKGIAEGVENSNFYLETTQDRFILTLFEKRADSRPALVRRPDRTPRQQGLSLRQPHPRA